MDELLSTDAAAKFLGVSKRTVQRLANNGTLRAFKLRGEAKSEWFVWVFTENDLLNFRDMKAEERRQAREEN